jgi:hypothetical protein
VPRMPKTRVFYHPLHSDSSESLCASMLINRVVVLIFCNRSGYLLANIAERPRMAALLLRLTSSARRSSSKLASKQAIEKLRGLFVQDEFIFRNGGLPVRSICQDSPDADGPPTSDINGLLVTWGINALRGQIALTCPDDFLQLKSPPQRATGCEPRPAPPIARCSPRAQRRDIRRDPNRHWLKLQRQVGLRAPRITSLRQSDGPGERPIDSASNGATAWVRRCSDRFGCLKVQC